MAKISRCLLIATLVVLGVHDVAAQDIKTEVYGLWCPYQHTVAPSGGWYVNGAGWSVNCTGRTECDRVHNTHLCDAHGRCAGGAGAVSSLPPGMKPARMGLAVPAAAVIGGAAGYYLGPNEEGNSEKAMNYALQGAGSFAALALVIRAKEVPPVVGAVVGAAAGAAIAKGYSGNLAITGNPEPSKLLIPAAAAAGALTGFSLPLIAKALVPGIRLPPGVAVGATPRRLSVRWLW